MHSVKLTVLIEDATDLDMEVRVVAPAAEQAAAGVIPMKPRAVVTTRDSVADDYTLGGYAGI